VADAYQALASLRVVLVSRREELKEKMAGGIEDGSYREHVGRCKQLLAVIEMVNQQIKSLNGDDDEPSK
jgi:hypothetical protein